PCVTVEDEDGQQVVRQLRPHGAGACEVVSGGVPLLADDHDLVPKPAPSSRERARVHVGARAAEQVAVPEDDLHGASFADLARGSPARAENRGLSTRTATNGRVWTRSCTSFTRKPVRAGRVPG